MLRQKGQKQRMACCIGMPLVCIVFFLVAGCRLIASAPSHQVIHKSASLTLQWDPPANDVHHNPNRAASYIIYYRDYGANYWRVLDIIPADANPQYTVEHARLGDGAYVFAVQSISASSSRSPIHTSLDNSADPLSGWYVFWVKSE